MKTSIKTILLFFLTAAIGLQLTAQSKCKDRAYSGREWTGEWDTNFGKLVLDQKGSRVTGTYRNLGTINGYYSSSTGKLKGTFTNKGNKGSFEFTLTSCEAFNGKWGWGTALNKGRWSGKCVRRRSATNADDINKLKITLVSVKSNKTWDNDGKDDYMLHFVPTLKLDRKEQQMKYKKYARIKNQIEALGPKNALHIRRTKGQSSHASVQLHLHKGGRINIQNSGIFEIPKNYRITNSGTDFNLTIVADEVSSTTQRIMTKNLKLDFKSIMEFLTGKKYPGNRRDFVDVIPASSSGLAVTQIQMKNGKRYVYDTARGYTKRNGKETGVEISYVLELVD
ncbi:hypothetical protein ACOKFD_06900 [Flagellimonas sp. S174]|uniref:hypothetical protein n=1 Tax=Flagellimonas sp. S174 TaxID=3410790 RepID=UPI003BF50332